MKYMMNSRFYSDKCRRTKRNVRLHKIHCLTKIMTICINKSSKTQHLSLQHEQEGCNHQHKKDEKWMGLPTVYTLSTTDFILYGAISWRRPKNTK